jgi:heat shock protein HslJ
MVNPNSVKRAAALLAVAFACLACDVASAGAEPAPGRWVLQKGRGVQFPLPHKPELQLQDQQLSGTTGCNAFTAKISEGPEQRIAIALLSLTRKLCGPKESRVENAIVSAFAETQFLQQDDQTLTFLSANREPLLIWKRADTVPAMRSMHPAVHSTHPASRPHVHRHTHRHVHRHQSCCRRFEPITLCAILTDGKIWRERPMAHHRRSHAKPHRRRFRRHLR